MNPADFATSLVAALGYAVTLGILAVVLFCAAAGAMLLLSWRAPKGTHRWPR
jgi:hypothetical protein